MNIDLYLDYLNQDEPSSLIAFGIHKAAIDLEVETLTQHLQHELTNDIYRQIDFGEARKYAPPEYETYIITRARELALQMIREKPSILVNNPIPF